MNLLALIQIGRRFQRAQDEILVPALTKLEAEKGKRHSAAVGLGVLLGMRSVMQMNEFPAADSFFDATDRELFGLTMGNLCVGLGVTPDVLTADMDPIANAMGEMMYPEAPGNIRRVQERAKARPEPQVAPEHVASPYDRAVAFVRATGKVDFEALRVELNATRGEVRAVIEQMEREGIVGPRVPHGTREVLMRQHLEAAAA
jgi:hypothetical protein